MASEGVAGGTAISRSRSIIGGAAGDCCPLSAGVIDLDAGKCPAGVMMQYLEGWRPLESM